MASDAEPGGQLAHRDICSADELARPGVIACHAYNGNTLSTEVGEAQPGGSETVQNDIITRAVTFAF